MVQVRLSSRARYWSAFGLTFLPLSTTQSDNWVATVATLVLLVCTAPSHFCTAEFEIQFDPGCMKHGYTLSI